MHVGRLIHQTFGQQRVQAAFDMYKVRPLKVNIDDTFIHSVWNMQERSEYKGAMNVCGSCAHQKEILTCPVLFHSINISFMYHF